MVLSRWSRRFDGNPGWFCALESASRQAGDRHGAAILQCFGREAPVPPEPAFRFLSDSLAGDDLCLVGANAARVV